MSNEKEQLKWIKTVVAKLVQHLENGIGHLFKTDTQTLLFITHVAATSEIPSRSHRNGGWSDVPVVALIKVNFESLSVTANKWTPSPWYANDETAALWGKEAPICGPWAKSMIHSLSLRGDAEVVVHTSWCNDETQVKVESVKHNWRLGLTSTDVMRCYG